MCQVGGQAAGWVGGQGGVGWLSVAYFALARPACSQAFQAFPPMACCACCACCAHPAEEFEDPLLGGLMHDPVQLPSGGWVGGSPAGPPGMPLCLADCPACKRSRHPGCPGSRSLHCPPATHCSSPFHPCHPLLFPFYSPLPTGNIVERSSIVQQLLTDPRDPYRSAGQARPGQAKPSQGGVHEHLAPSPAWSSCMPLHLTCYVPRQQLPHPRLPVLIICADHLILAAPPCTLD